MSFPLWETTLPILPQRSQLYSLSPIGLNTSFVESLTSYICRLAYEHHVEVGTLIQYTTAPVLGKHYIADDQIRSISSFLRYANPINGNGLMASDWVEALEVLTLREDLALLTLLVGTDALSQRDLLQPVRQWCSACYDLWKRQENIIYEPLLWSIKAVSVCPKHGQRLERRCPCCSSSLPWLTWYSRPGYCSACGKWLGRVNRDSQIEEKEIYIAEIAGDFLAHIPRLSLPMPRERVIQSLRKIIAETTDGNMAIFSHHLGLPKTSLWELVHGHFPPSFPFLLHLCYQFRLSLLQLLGDAEPIVSDESPLLQKQIQRQDARVPFDYGRVQQSLEVILSDQQSSPPSMRATARQLGYPVRTIEIHFPEQCREISRRYSEGRKQHGVLRKAQLRDSVNKAARIALFQGDKLTYRRVGFLMGKPGCFREHEARKALLDNRYRLGTEIPTILRYSCKN